MIKKVLAAIYRQQGQEVVPCSWVGWKRNDNRIWMYVDGNIRDLKENRELLGLKVLMEHGFLFSRHRAPHLAAGSITGDLQLTLGGTFLESVNSGSPFVESGSSLEPDSEAEAPLESDSDSEFKE